MDVIQCQDRKKTQPLCLPPLLIPLNNVLCVKHQKMEMALIITQFSTTTRGCGTAGSVHMSASCCLKAGLLDVSFMVRMFWGLCKSCCPQFFLFFFLQVRQWFDFQMNKRKRKWHAITTWNINTNTRYEAGCFFFGQSNQISVKCHCSLWTAWNQTHFTSQPEQNVRGLKDLWLIRPKMKRVIYQIWI